MSGLVIISELLTVPLGAAILVTAATWIQRDRDESSRQAAQGPHETADRAAAARAPGP